MEVQEILKIIVGFGISIVLCVLGYLIKYCIDLSKEVADTMVLLKIDTATLKQTLVNFEKDIKEFEKYKEISQEEINNLKMRYLELKLNNKQL